MSTDSFRDYVLEQLGALDGLRCRRMFGGHGLYSGERFFGIVYDGRLSCASLNFKTNPGNLPDFLSRDCAVFAPSEKQVLRNYREVPVEILEDAESLTHWARRAAQG